MNSLTLDNGRILAYCEYGNKNGNPIFICHGLNSSRLEAKIYNHLIFGNEFRIIGIDRPGIGGSSFLENRTILDFTDDITAVADKLMVDKFAIIGVSAGAAYALACTYKISKRLISCHIISGLGVIEESLDFLSTESKSFIIMTKKYPWIVKPVLWLLIGRHPKENNNSENFLNNILQSLNDVDKDSLNEPIIRSLFKEAFREAYEQGTKGVAYDSILAYAKPWGFNLQDIKFDHIYLYNGGKDASIPIEMGEKMHSLLKNSNYKLYEDDGHLSTAINHVTDITKNITIAWRGNK